MARRPPRAVRIAAKGGREGRKVEHGVTYIIGPALIPRLALLVLPAAVWLAWLLLLPPRPPAALVWISGAPLLLWGSWLAHRGQEASWRDFVARTLDGHALAAMLLIALGVQFEDAHGITTDGVIYFSQLRSVLFDGDLNVAAEFAYLGQPPRPYHVVPIGPTPIWLPLYLAVAAVDAAGRAFGLWQGPADPAGLGLTLPYVRAALVSSFAIGAAGLAILHHHLRPEFGRGVTLATTVLVFAATPLVWYMVYEPSMTHAASFGFVALFVVAAARWTSTAIGIRRSIALGALLGLAFISRPQEALFALFPAILLGTEPAPWRQRGRAALRLAAWALAGAAPFLVLQAVHSAVLFSRENFALVGAGGYLDVGHSRWADTLWSSWHGFLSWTPVAYVALVGTACSVRRRARWALATLFLVFLMAWVNGSTADWAAGWSFGGRRFTSCLVVLAPGLAVVLAALIRRPLIAVAVVAMAAIGWNQLLVAQYAQGLLPGGEAVGFDRLVRQQAELATRRPFVYPFAFPANAWFAWRTGLPIDRYDLLAPQPLESSVDVSFDRGAEAFLLDGWSARGAEPFGELRWMDGARAEVVLPLDVPADTSPIVEVTARTRRLDPPARATVAVSLAGQQLGTFAPDTERPSVGSFQAPPGLVGRGYYRVVLDNVSRAADPDAPLVAVYRVTVRPRAPARTE